ncbi:MAG: UDP-3-O-(3-hydroxymyristoyl)glucosamine N-acyltransferase [Methylophaga sp.]|nr:MAG: UDP-3-O-(3-hydroxymyristoyl)glucosamine N-acyltransferase [Methylophaga sp.]
MWTLESIAKHIDGIVKGDKTYQVGSIATLESAHSQQISFLANPKYKKYLVNTKAGAVIVHSEMASAVPNQAIVVDDPYIAYAKTASLLNPVELGQQGIHSRAYVSSDSDIHPTACIGAQVVIESGVVIAEGVVIGPGCVLQQGVKVGKNTRLVANITLCVKVQIGQRVIIHPGVVIGADGFGIANDKGKWIKVPQLGSVIVGNDVEIGANTTIDKGAIENTIIGTGVKLDNQIQIAHNVVIGEHTVIAGCAGIAGSTQIGKYCIIGGGVAISGHLTICDRVQLTGMTMVTKSITTSGSYSSGIPAEPTKQWHRSVVRYRQMDKLADRVKRLEVKNKPLT